MQEPSQDLRQAWLLPGKSTQCQSQYQIYPAVKISWTPVNLCGGSTLVGEWLLISSMERRSLTVLRVSLYHPTLGSTAFANVPLQLQHDTSHLLVGRGRDTHLQLQLPQLSRHHLSLEPYLEKGHTLLAFCLKVLSRKSSVWVNGLPLRYLEQAPLSTANRISFSGIQMVVLIDRGTSLEAFVCAFHFSPSPLIYRPKAEETDEGENIFEEELPPALGELTPGLLGSLHGCSKTQTAASSQALEEEQK